MESEPTLRDRATVKAVMERAAHLHRARQLKKQLWEMCSEVATAERGLDEVMVDNLKVIAGMLQEEIRAAEACALIPSA